MIADLTGIKEALWGGRIISYRPGRLRVALNRSVDSRKAYESLVKAGCCIEYPRLKGDSFEVVVPIQDTLRLAVSLGTSPMFRYVEPDIVEPQKEKENFD